MEMEKQRKLSTIHLKFRMCVFLLLNTATLANESTVTDPWNETVTETTDLLNTAALANERTVTDPWNETVTETTDLLNTATLANESTVTDPWSETVTETTDLLNTATLANESTVTDPWNETVTETTDANPPKQPILSQTILDSVTRINASDEVVYRGSTTENISEFDRNSSNKNNDGGFLGNSTSNSSDDKNVDNVNRGRTKMIYDYGTISKETERWIAYVGKCVLTPIIAIPGVIGNTVGLVVLWKDGNKYSFYYLFTLTLFDILTLFSYLFYSTLSIIKELDPLLGEYILAYVFPVFTIYFGVAIGRTSTSIICFLAAERFVAVKWPLHVKSFVLSSRSKIIAVSIVIFNFVFYFPNLFRFETFSFYDPMLNVTRYSYRYTQLAQNTLFYNIYGMLGQILYMYLPLCLVTILNVGIVTITTRSSLERKKLHGAKESEHFESEQMKLTFILMIVSAFLIMSHLPVTVTLTLAKFSNDYKYFGREHYLLNTISHISDVFVVVNAANDFIVYIAVSKKFRGTFRQLFQCQTKVAKKTVFEQAPITTTQT